MAVALGTFNFRAWATAVSVGVKSRARLTEPWHTTGVSRRPPSPPLISAPTRSVFSSCPGSAWARTGGKLCFPDSAEADPGLWHSADAKQSFAPGRSQAEPGNEG